MKIIKFQKKILLTLMIFFIIGINKINADMITHGVKCISYNKSCLKSCESWNDMCLKSCCSFYLDYNFVRKLSILLIIIIILIVFIIIKKKRKYDK